MGVMTGGGGRHAGPLVDSIDFYAAHIRQLEDLILEKQQEILQVALIVPSLP
jgi:hypothetical protein